MNIKQINTLLMTSMFVLFESCVIYYLDLLIPVPVVYGIPIYWSLFALAINIVLIAIIHIIFLVFRFVKR